MKSCTFFLLALFFATTACTLDKTDYEEEINAVVPEYSDFKEVVSFHSGIYKITIEALNGTFYKGYNEIRLKIVDTQKNEFLGNSKISFFPVQTAANGAQTSCPHSNNLALKPTDNYYSGYSVFLNESENWKIHIQFTADDQTYQVAQDVAVYPQLNKNLNMTQFIGDDNREYIIALIAPQKPNVAENQLVAGIYKQDTQIETGTDAIPYTEVTGYTLKLDPRMPEPSMGNHSSPNNQDLNQRTDGLYYGVVNYTMTGNWTLNFILLDSTGDLVKGTPVPTDFTPGVEGVKSELHIDILF